MKFKIFPAGYDPMVASGPPNKDAIRAGCNWTEANTLHHLEMDIASTIVEVDDEKQLPAGIWHQEVDENDNKLVLEQIKSLREKLKINILKWRDWEVKIVKRFYPKKRLAIFLETTDGEPLITASVNIPEYNLEANEVCIKSYSENEGVLEWLIENKIVEDTGKRVKTGFVEVSVCRLIGDICQS